MKVEKISFEEAINKTFSKEVYRIERPSISVGSKYSSEQADAVVIPRVYDTRYAEKRRAVTRKTVPYIPLGSDNRYPQFLMDLQERSQTHKRAQKSIVSIGFGEGIEILGLDSDSRRDDLNKWLKSKKLTFENIFSLLQNIAASGGAYVTFNFTSKANSAEEFTRERRVTKPILGSLFVPKFYKSRLGQPEENGEIEYHWYSEDFGSEKPKKSNLKGYKVYNPELLEDLKTGEITVMDWRKDKPFYKKKKGESGEDPKGMDKYSYYIHVPSLKDDHYGEACYESSGAINAILIDEALINFDIAGLENGLSAGYIVIADLEDTSTENPEMYEEQKQAITDKVEEELVGVENRGRPIIIFRDDRKKGQGIQIAEIPHTNDADIHNVIENRKDRAILTAYGVTEPRLIGMPSRGGGDLSNQADLIIEAENVWYNTVIRSELVQPVEQFLNEIILPIAELELGSLEGVTLALKRKRMYRKEPSDAILLSEFLNSEIRGIYGSAPLTDEERVQLQEEREARQRRSPTTRSN